MSNSLWPKQDLARKVDASIKEEQGELSAAYSRGLKNSAGGSGIDVEDEPPQVLANG